jgi:hypothetical protein
MQKKNNKENVDLSNSHPEAEDTSRDLSNLVLADFLCVVEQQGDSVELEAKVNISVLPKGRRERADMLSKLVWEKLNYRFL